jgi:hypothetical protein
LSHFLPKRILGFDFARDIHNLHHLIITYFAKN